MITSHELGKRGKRASACERFLNAKEITFLFLVFWLPLTTRHEESECVRGSFGYNNRRSSNLFHPTDHLEDHKLFQRLSKKKKINTYRVCVAAHRKLDKKLLRFIIRELNTVVNAHFHLLAEIYSTAPKTKKKRRKVHRPGLGDGVLSFSLKTGTNVYKIWPSRIAISDIPSKRFGRIDFFFSPHSRFEFFIIRSNIFIFSYIYI